MTHVGALKHATATKTGAAKKYKAGDPAPAHFVITDDPGLPGTYKVMGTNAAGDLLDISAVSTIAATDDASGCTQSTVVGTSNFTVQGKKATPPDTPALVTIVATWTDGSIGPFTGTASFTVTPGGVTGFTVVPA